MPPTLAAAFDETRNQKKMRALLCPLHPAALRPGNPRNGIDRRFAVIGMTT